MAYKVSSGSRNFGDIIFEEDTDTGIDFAANKVALEANGQERLIADANGVHTLGSYRVSVTNTNAATYAVTATDHYIVVDTSSTGHHQININQVTADDTGRILVIMDGDGGANNSDTTITITAGIGHGSDPQDTIGASSNYLLDTPGEVVTLLCTGTGGWQVISKIT